MKFKQWIQAFLVGASVIALAACSSAHKTPGNTDINTANAAVSDSAQASGAGQQAGFGDQGNAELSSRRIYYFDFDSNVVHEDDKPAIIANADYLVAHPKVKALLEGHTDPRGSREYNIGLGERRAKAVAEILVSKGVSPSQLRIVSYGAEKPAIPGHDEAAYQKDRRSVLIQLQS